MRQTAFGGNLSIKISGRSTMLRRRETSVSGLIKRIDQNQPLSTSAIEPRIAVSQKQKLEACQLAFQEYTKKGYIQNGSNGQLVLDYDTSSKTIIINAMSDEKLAGTITLTDPKHMPCLELFKDSVQSLGVEAEVSRFAVADEFKNNKSVLNTLFDLILTISIRVFNYDKLYIEVNPRHTGFYQKFLDFQVVSDVVQCSRVNNAPAVLMYLDLKNGNFNKPEFKNLNKPALSEELIASIYESGKIRNRIGVSQENIVEV